MTTLSSNGPSPTATLTPSTPSPSELAVATDDASIPLWKVWTIVNFVEVIAATFFVLCRTYIRIFRMKTWTWADTVLTIAWLCFSIGVLASVTNASKWCGIHVWDIDPEILALSWQHLNSGSIIYLVGLCVVKVAILLQFLEIFVPAKRTTRWWVVIGLLTVNITFFLLWFFLTVFQCWPRQAIWNPQVAGKCMNFHAILVSTATFNMIDDWIMFALPIYWVQKLQMARKRKLSIFAVFGCAFIACCCSLMRLVESIQKGGSKDVLVDYVPIILWAQAELAMGFIVACLPYIPRLFKRTRQPSESASGMGNSGQSSAVRRFMDRQKRGDVYISLDERPPTHEELGADLPSDKAWTHRDAENPS